MALICLFNDSNGGLLNHPGVGRAIAGTEWLGAFDPAGGAPAVVAGGEISIRSFASSGTATARHVICFLLRGH